MSPSPQLAPPGSSSYTSQTMHVGDGTWDSSRDDFLLPNLVGLNFATMRYNGMGNRFFTMTGYHSLIEAHGVIAAITFLILVPAAIFLMRFFGRNPRNALRFHIWLQILTLFLSTVVIILGCFAVGPKRSLTNPHHGIGIAIYVLIWIQAMGGCLVHRGEKRRFHLPLRAMLHHWLGRIIALLGIVQVPLGLTLYGSPQFLFVLYTLWVLGLVVLYFILEWVHERRREPLGREGNYVSEEVVEGRTENRHSGLGKLAAAGVAGVGLAALFRRRSQNKSRHGNNFAGTESGTSYLTEEKLSEREHHGWGRRILEVGAIGGGLAALKGVFNRRGHDDDASDVGPYRPPLGGNQSVTTDSMSRIEEGRPPINPVVGPPGGSPGFIRPSHPLAAPPLTPDRRNSGSSYYYGSSVSGSPSRRDRRHTWRNALVGGGVVLAARQLFKNRRQKKEERRAEDLRVQRVDEERIARMNSAHRYTGDGVTPPRRVRNTRIASQSGSYFSGSLVDGPSGVNPAVPVAAGVGTAAAAALADRDRIRPVGTDPFIAPPGPPSAIGMPISDVPPIPPAHRTDSSGSEMYTTTSGRQRNRHHLRDEAAAGLAGAAIGAAAMDARRRQSGRNTDSVESPPVSLKVKMHEDGRHVTLRRLTEEEAAAQRDARRQERRASSGRRRRNSSIGSSSGGEVLGADASNRRWRRAEAIEAQQEAENRAAVAAATVNPSGYPRPPPPGTHVPSLAPPAIDPQTGQAYSVPPPPPIPGSSSALGNPAGSITSPGTETSGGATEYANNRRRRRAERAQAKLAREGRAGGGNTVDFT